MLTDDSPGAALAATLQLHGNIVHSRCIPRPTPHSDKPLNMTTPDSSVASVTRESLIAGLNEDLAREYQAIIAYVVYSQAIKGAQYMTIAKELEVHAAEELSHALIIANQIDYLGGEITATPKPVKTSDDPKAMLRFDLENERETILAYRERVRQCEALGEYAISEHIREILLDEQEHLVDLATALGEDPPNLSTPPKGSKQ
jgi:bacterioferritin